ncbi:hypothetical protein M406DRAFT_321945 [Cryphonectria parasitica EP155]|uniref:Peptidyl-tRNA hydrolase n=1 Tax=Cryphonectria parasitica (strain ATCC 38755 / EP155) TaxID=660469 RepID=A0A9P5CPI2_CRYP1|nr:uncharacterized protein M406DRAFT_321945 [Cryphonectria parasitica EP155]KAF3765452.1 hypothetical protein M406DRAFT_321945 [Cryphonectria parasitica EP155]
MRFSAFSVLSVLTSLAVAQDFEQYQAQFQNFLGQFGSYLPNPSKHDPVGAAEAKAGEMKMDVLTLSNWRETLYSPVTSETTTPEEWLVFVTGRNKTCFGHCLGIETAFNQSAAKLALLPDAPHVGYINCDDQPILCNVWSAGAGHVYLIEMLPEPAPIDIYSKRLNLTTTTADTFVELYKTREDKTQFKKKDGYFHPFDGELVKYGVSVPVAYLLWGLSVVPSWAMMLGVSFLSRTMMNRRMAPQGQGRPAAAAQAAAAPQGTPRRGAPAGDAWGTR